MSYAVGSLCRHLAARGHDVELACLAASGNIPGVRLDVHPKWPVLRRFAVSPSHVRAVRLKARDVDIVHNHGLWSMVNMASGWVVPGQGAKLVTSPHGTLAPWALGHKRLRKRTFWPVQKRVLSRADLLHATSDAEFADIRALGLTAPATIVANGIDVPERSERMVRGPVRTLLFLGRIHPIKGIDGLLLAWQALQTRFRDWRLVIAGRGEAAHERSVRELATALGLQRVEFPGPLYGGQKSQAYFEAGLFVLPSHSENFGITVAESLAHGCPAIVSRGAPWARLDAERCGWWVEQDSPALISALGFAMNLPRGELEAMGKRGRAWMEREFGWASVAERVEAAYRWVLDGGERPTSIRID